MTPAPFAPPIASVTATPFAIPFRRALATAGGGIVERAGVLVRLSAAGGLAGIGEAAPHPAAGPGALDAAVAALREAAPRAAEGVGGVPAWVDEVPDGAARAGLEMAWYDLAARAAGVRVAELFGAVRRERVAVNALLDEREPKAAAAAARDLVARGFRCLKLKVAPRDLDGEAARLAAVREGAGEGVALRLDANAAWTVGEAVAALRRLGADGVEYVEQPVAEIADLAEVRRAVAVPIAADESVTGPEAVERIAAAGAADVVVIKPALLGLRAAAAAARAARERGIGVVITSALDTSIGIAAALHLAAALPDPLPPCGLATAALLAGDLAREPLIAEGGYLRLPSGPGLGVEVDAAALRRWSTGR